MARQPQLNINVNSRNFQQFAQQFNAFSGQIRQLNAQFAQINNQLNRTNSLVRAVNASVRAVLAPFRSLGNEVKKITKHIISWSTLIGGITALLGAGGGLFGIERLAKSIMDKRRQALGLGQSYAQTQASQISQIGLTDSTRQGQEAIAMGLHGSMDEYTALMKLGIDPSTNKMSPADIQYYIDKKIPEMAKMGGPSKLLLYSHEFGIDKFRSAMDIMRLATEEGQRELEIDRQLSKEYEKQLQLSPRAQRAWAEFYKQLEAAGVQLESIFGEALAGLADPLRHLSQAFADMVAKVIKSDKFHEMIDKLGGWIDTLATKMESLSQEQIDTFLDEMEKSLPKWFDLNKGMEEFINILHAIKIVSEYLKPLVDKIIGDKGSGSSWAAKAGQWVHDRLENQNVVSATTEAKNLAHWNQGQGRPNPVFTTWGNATVGGTREQPPFLTGLGHPWSTAPFGQVGTPGPIGDWRDTVPGLAGGAEKGYGWSGAAKSMVPITGGGEGGTVTPSNPSGRLQQQGALSTDQWQMTRVANLVVRNVPGSNIHMTATSMVG